MAPIPVLATKDPADVRPYSRDWTLFLTDLNDTIATSVWAPDQDSIVVNDDTFDTLGATVILSGGTAGTVYTLTNHITTANGYTYERSIKVPVSDQ